MTKDYECPDTNMVLPMGMTIVIPISGIHHDPDIYDQPEEFLPERFTPEEIQKRPNGSFLPFGDGPRNCIGLRFGMMEAQIGLVMLLRNFKFTTCDRTPPMPLQFSPNRFFLSPISDVMLNFQTV